MINTLWLRKNAQDKKVLQRRIRVSILLRRLFNGDRRGRAIHHAIWAAFDGSICARPMSSYNVFTVVVPDDDLPGSIKNMFIEWIRAIWGIPLTQQVYVSFKSSEYEDGKDIACVSIYSKQWLGLLASKILAVVGEYELSYLTHDRMESLTQMNQWHIAYNAV
jgi:hypothetical protein